MVSSRKTSGLTRPCTFGKDKTSWTRSILSGRFVETYIVNEIRKNYRNNGVKDNFYYYRDNNQNEIDLIVLDGGLMHLIECKSGVSFTSKDVKSFTCLKDTSYQKGDNFVICNTPAL